jgi:hypothetical protein
MAMSQNFYDTLYMSEGTSGMDDVVDSVAGSVTPEMNSKLITPFDSMEIKVALFQMYPTKAPGPDGFPAHLFQRYWDLCGEEVTRAVLKILNGEDSPEVINKTFIVLIPKVAQPEEIGNSSLLAYAMSFIKLPRRFLRIG